MIYLFDKNEKLIRIVSRKSIKTAQQKFSLADRYISDRLEIEMKAMSDTDLEKVEYMAIQSIDNKHKFHFFYVLQKETEGFITSLTGVQSGIEELRKTPVYEKRPRAMEARPVIEDLLRNTNWTPRYIASTKFKNTMFYYTSVFESLKKACEVWDLEMQFFVEMNGNQIGARYIDFKKKIGKAVGKRVVYGHNALTIIQEVERTELYTALIGRGKGEEVSSAEENESGKAGYGRKINFEEIVWRKSEGKPVDKPAGQRYVEIPEMTKRYGIRQTDGTMKPKIGFIEFGEEEDRELLLEQTYEALVTASRPAVTFKTTTAYLKDVEIGDTVRVIRHDRNLYYETRVFEITFNRLNNTSADIKLGDKVTGGSTSSTIQSAVDKAIEDWVVEDFNKFVEKLPDFLPSADGFNQNWYSEEDPTITHPKKVMIGDIWYKPDPEHEGHKIMLRWTGEMWEEILRTYNAERLKVQIENEMAELDGKMRLLDDELKSKVVELLTKAGVAEAAADDAKRLAEQAILNLNSAQERSNSAIRDALSEARRLDQEERKATERAILTARNKANEEARRLIGLSERALQESINDLSTEVTKTNDVIKLKADKTTVDNLTGKVSQAEASLRVQAGEIASRVKNSDFDKEKEKIRTVETNIRQLDEKITTEISQTNAKIDSFKVGSRNYAEDYDFSRGLWEYSQGDSSQTTRGVTDGVFTMTTTALTWHQWQIHSESGARLGGKLDSTALLELEIGETYTLSVEAKVNSGSPDFWFELRDNGKVNYNNVVSHFGGSGRFAKATSNWVRYSVTGVIKPNSDFGHRRIILGYSGIGSISFRKVELTKSSTVTDAGPAPEDTTSEITTVKTTIAQTAEGTRQLSTKLAQAENKISRQETQVNQLIGDVSSKVSQTDYNNLKKSVDSHTTEINQTKSSIKLKADRSQVDELSSRFRAELQVANDAINAKVSKTEFNSEKNRVTNAETLIDTLASQISTKLSRTEVNQLIDTKGFITNSTFTNTIEQTERGLTARIAQVETKIPDGYSGANLILEGARQTSGQYWGNTVLVKHSFYHNSEKYHFQLNTDKSGEIISSSNRFKVKRNTKYALSFWTYSSGNMKHFDVWFLGRKKGETQSFTLAKRIISEKAPSPHRAEYVTFVFDSGGSDEGYIRFDNNGSNNGTTAILGFAEVMLVEGDTPARYSPSPDELATTTALHEVRDTVDGHTRTLTAQGRSISQVTQTAEGIVSRVANTENSVSRLDGRANFVESALNSTKTEVSQLAGAWAVKNLTSSGTVLNQLNLNKDGSVKIDGSLVQITGKTYIQDGVITSAKIGNLDAGKITTGILDAHRVTIVNMDASNIVTGQMSANRIRGGTISSLNDRSQINLQNGRFYVSDNEAGFFRVDSQASTMGLKFINYNERINGSQRKVSRVILGGDRRQEGSDSNFGWDKGGFTGIVISTVKGAVSADGWQVDDVQLIGDRVVFSHSYYADKNATNLPQQGWEMYNYVYNSPRKGNVLLRPYMIDKNQSAIETGNLFLYPRKDKSVNLLEVLRELKVGFVHIKNAGFSDAAYNAIVSSINKLSSLGI
ncbi:phage tail spike protein [Streptococcus sp. NLN76]|uniref:phage tail spike protein n=1 Tax=Streptococcus sp. NLN76 TaxID=2822800 RepID=UPI0018A97499|nr:phage tail spike protein [Streptococcus sp. NLN76]MBF8970154.1 phage tail protein [Streptococcus sp. NLN76]